MLLYMVILSFSGCIHENTAMLVGGVSSAGATPESNAALIAANAAAIASILARAADNKGKVAACKCRKVEVHPCY
jgi:hypothetical protein